MSHKTVYCGSVEAMESIAAAFLRVENFPNPRYHSVRVEILTDSGFTPAILIYEGNALIRTFRV